MQSLLDDGFHICKLMKSKGFEIFCKPKLVMLFVFQMLYIRSSLNHIHFLPNKQKLRHYCGYYGSCYSLRTFHNSLILSTEECPLSSYNLFFISPNMHQVIKRNNKPTSNQLFDGLWRNPPQQTSLMWTIYPASWKSCILSLLSMQCNPTFLCRDNFQPLGTFLLLYHLQVQYTRNWT